MTAAVVTWSGGRRHYPNPRRHLHTLCGRRIDHTTRDTQTDIDTRPACKRCERKASKP